MKRTTINKYIYKTKHGKYFIHKQINNKRITYKTCETLDEAIKYRDKLIANNWQPLEETPEEKLKKEQQEYYKYIQKAPKGQRYKIVNNKDGYLGTTGTIEEALYFRDLYSHLDKKDCPKPKDIDLKTDNPYIQNGLKYPIPERLILKEKTSNYGNGTIAKKGKTSYHIYRGGKGNGRHGYICACATYEEAYYIREELQKNNWNLSKLEEIRENYPKYYTKLLYFYQYISKNSHIPGKYIITFPKQYTKDCTIDHIIYTKIEDALYERDFLKENEWDYDLLVETLDDTKNPYYDMTLPPYPERKIRNISDINYHEKELSEIIEFVKSGIENQRIICEKLNIRDATLRKWLHKWNTNWSEFKNIIHNGENPLEILEKKERIYQPDLSRALPNNWNNWVSYLKKLNRYQVRKGTETFGVYESEELAHKISNELQKVNWDKSKLKDIQAKFGYVSPVMSKRWIYKGGRKWYVRRKNKHRRMLTYGGWHDKRIAIIVRDMLILYGWKMENMDWIEPLAIMAVDMIDNYQYTMFGKVTLEDIEHIETSNTLYRHEYSPGRYKVVKSGVYYGTYSEEKADEVVEFLEENDWNKELLEVMIEIGEI